MTATVLPAADPSALLLDVRSVGRLLDCSPRHVVRLADSGRLPPPIKLGRLIRWRRSDLEKFLATAGQPEGR